MEGVTAIIESKDGEDKRHIKHNRSASQYSSSAFGVGVTTLDQTFVHQYRGWFVVEREGGFRARVPFSYPLPQLSSSTPNR